MVREVDWRELLPTAYLLTGSDTGARDLLARGLSRGGGLDGLVRAHLRRRLARDTSIAGTSGDPWWLSADDVAAAGRTAAALDALPRADRTAAVLRWHEGLPADRVAALVPGADLTTLPDRLGIPAAELPRRLEGLAALADQRDLTDEDVADGVRALRSRRRVRVGLAVAAVAVLGAGALLVPHVLPSRAGPAAGASTSATADPALGPARGSLVEDTAFVAGLRDQLDPDEDDGRLLYAGDAAGSRWALLVRSSSDGVAASWFVGEEGAAPEDLVQLVSLWSPGYLPEAWSAATSSPDGSAVLVLAAPGDEVQLSNRFEVDRDGLATRTFAPVTVTDGVAAERLDGSGTARSVVYRVVRDDRVVATESPSDVVVDSGTTPAGQPALTSRSGTGVVDPTAYGIALDQITRPTGRDPATADVVVLGTGSYPAPGGTTLDAVTVAVQLPGGAIVTSTATSGPNGGDACGVETHPAGTDPATLTVVTRCASYAGDSSTFGATLLVVAPPGVGVALGSDSGGDVQTPALEAGWGFVVDGVDDLTQFTADGFGGRVSRSGNGPFDRF